MLTFANVVHFFAYEFSRLCAGGFSFARIFLGSFDCFFFGHHPPPGTDSVLAEVGTVSKDFCMCVNQFP